VCRTAGRLRTGRSLWDKKLRELSRVVQGRRRTWAAALAGSRDEWRETYVSAPPLKPCRKTRRSTSAGMGSMAVGVTWEGRDVEAKTRV
jgi:hypothetical protein